METLKASRVRGGLCIQNPARDSGVGVVKAALLGRGIEGGREYKSVSDMLIQDCRW